MKKTLNFPDGSKYVGEVKDEKLHGKGTYSGSLSGAKNLKLNIPPYKIGIPDEIIIIGEFKDNQIYANTCIFSTDASFALITSSNEKEFKGWIAEEEGSYFSLFDKNKSNSPTDFDKEQYRDALEVGFKGSFEDFIEQSELITDDYIQVEDPGLKSELNHRYIIEHEEYFKKTGWFPNERFKNKTSFKKALIKWKKDSEFFK